MDALERQRIEVENAIKNLGRQVGEIAARAGFEGATRQLRQLQADIQNRQQDATVINAQVARLRLRMLEPDELVGAIEAFDPLWETLPPAQKARLVHLLIERVEYDGENKTISLTFHPTGIRTLTAEQRENATCPTN